MAVSGCPCMATRPRAAEPSTTTDIRRYLAQVRGGRINPNADATKARLEAHRTRIQACDAYGALSSAEEDARIDAWADGGLSSPRRARVRSAGGQADVRHPEVNGDLPGSAHSVELLGCGRHGGLDRGDLAHPALILDLLETVGEVGVNLLQSRQLGRVDPKQWASDTRVFVLARRSVVAAAGSES